MIREYQPNDLDQIMSIWLKGNEQAHHFIDPEFFRKNYDLVKLLLPSSSIYVQDIEGIKGFIGLTDNYISGLFVAENYRHQNIGKALIAKAKQLYHELFVHVYKKNTAATAFYLSQGFTIIAESINEENYEAELMLSCKVQHTVKIGQCAL